MSVPFVLESSAAVIDTPVARQNVDVTLNHAPDRLHTFDISICFDSGKVATRTMQVYTLRAALASPGELIDEGCITVMADPSYDIVTIYLPAWDGDYAVLRLNAHAVRSFVDNVAAAVSTKWSLAQAASMSAERAIDEVASEGFVELCEWLARQ